MTDFTAQSLQTIPHSTLMTLGGFWSMMEDQVVSAVGILHDLSADALMKYSADFQARAEANAKKERPAANPYDVVLQGDTAIISIVGTMTKRPHCLDALFGNNASTLNAIQQMRWAKDNKDIKHVAMHIESGGGELAGAFDLAAMVAATASVKPVIAYIEDIGASAAYLAASNASRIVTNASGIVGNIGVYTVLQDVSAMADKKGIKPILIKSGEFKGVGTAGLPITEEHKAFFQDNIDKMHGLFKDAVKNGRNLTEAQWKKLSDGQIYVGADAVAHGLADAVGSMEEVLASFSSMKLDGGVFVMSGNATVSDNTLEELESDPVIAGLIEGTEAQNTGAPVVDATLFATFLGAAGLDASVSIDRAVELVKAGLSYETKLRAAAVRMGIVAGLGERAAFVEKLDVAGLVDYLGSTTTIAREKGLLEGKRLTMAAGATTEAGGTTTAPTEKPAVTIADNVRAMRQSGLYDF